MTRWIRRLPGILLLATVVVGSAYVGWRWGDPFFGRLQLWSDARPAGEGVARREAGPELAQETMARVDAFRKRRAGAAFSELSLGRAEVASLIRFSVPGILPPGVIRPRIEMGSGRLRISSRVVVAEVPPVPDLERFVGIFPDTVPVSLEASLMPYGEEVAALIIHRMHAAGVPLPRRAIPPVLSAMGRTDRPGLPPDAVTVSLPDGVGSAYILSDSLILVSARK